MLVTQNTIIEKIQKIEKNHNATAALTVYKCSFSQKHCHTDEIYERTF